MSLIFEVRDGLGTFVPADEEAATKELTQLRDLVVAVGEDETDRKKGIKTIKGMIAKNPLFLRGYAILAEMYDGAEEEDEASETYVKGCRAALKIIPEDFSGPLDVENSDVQCFLRCHAGYVEALVAKGDYQAALEASHRQLVFDPGDMFERRRELGELSIMAGRSGEAEAILRDQVETRPTAYYSLAYLALEKGEHAQAVNLLRRAFILAPYAVDLLTGRLVAPNIFWEDGPQAPDYREDLLYVEMLGGDLWTRNDDAHAFLEWLSQTSAVLREKADMVALSEKCFRAPTEDYDAACETAEAELESLLSGLDDKSAAALIAEVEDPKTGESVTPWELLTRHHERLSDLYSEGDDYYEPDDDCGCGGHAEDGDYDDDDDNDDDGSDDLKH